MTKNNRSGFCHSISVIGAAHPVGQARRDFFGSVLLVCSLGILAKLMQALLAP